MRHCGMPFFLKHSFVARLACTVRTSIAVAVRESVFTGILLFFLSTPLIGIRSSEDAVAVIRLWNSHSAVQVELRVQCETAIV